MIGLSSKITKLFQDRESIAYPYMDFQKSTDINRDIYDFLILAFNYTYKCGYPH